MKLADKLNNQLEEKFASFEKKIDGSVSNFDKAKADHEVALKRMEVAKWTIYIMSGLLLLSLVALCFFLNIPEKNHILSVYISSIFGTITLTLGFIAGSSIDKK